MLKNRMLLKVMLGLAVVCALASILQMWFTLFMWDTFWKLIITLVILGVLVAFIMAIKEDMGETKKLKDDNYLD